MASNAELYWKIRSSIYKNYAIVQKTLPYRTGNLAYNAFKITDKGDHNYTITIDLDIAPYAYYLDEGKPIGNSDKHKGFWDRAMKQFMQAVAADLQAELTEE